VAGDIHDRDPAAAREIEVGEAEVDRHPTTLLFLEAIGIDGGQRFDERRLSMIDMARGADNEGSSAPAFPGLRGRGNLTLFH
jgi:hypothetical protein